MSSYLEENYPDPELGGWSVTSYTPSDWSVTRIYPHFPHLIGPLWEYTQGATEQVVSYYSYQANCGEGAVWGDAVTDLATAKLEVRNRVVKMPNP
eukprot:3689360-Pyramimonas_sp.AAC.1